MLGHSLYSGPGLSICYVVIVMYFGMAQVLCFWPFFFSDIMSLSNILKEEKVKPESVC